MTSPSLRRSFITRSRTRVELRKFGSAKPIPTSPFPELLDRLPETDGRLVIGRERSVAVEADTGYDRLSGSPGFGANERSTPVTS